MRELGRFFRTYCHDQHTAWARYLKSIEQWLNLTTHCVTGFTPYELHYGQPAQSKIRSLIKFPEGQPELHHVKIELANKRTLLAHVKQKARQRFSNKPPFKEGDLVLRKVSKQSNALEKRTAKFFHVYFGPYKIARVFNDNAYELVSSEDSQNVIGHYNRIDLKKYRHPALFNNIENNTE